MLIAFPKSMLPFPIHCEMDIWLMPFLKSSKIGSKSRLPYIKGKMDRVYIDEIPAGRSKCHLFLWEFRILLKIDENGTFE